MKNAILLSIHPNYVKKILAGEKIYEFRKVKTSKQVDKIYIYSTAPISKIIASADVEEVIVDNPDVVWEKTKEFSGIDKEFFLEYYSNKSKAVVYKLTNITKLEKELSLSDFDIKYAPQSFTYIKDIVIS